MKAAYQTRKLGDLCHIARGGSPRPIQDYLTDAPDGINWVKISDATASDKYIEYTKEKIRPQGLKKSRLVKPGDFILSNSMSFGRPYIMKTTGCIHDGWLVLSDKCGLFDPDFLYHFLGSDAAYRQFDGLAAGSTVRNLNSDLVKTVDVPIPPLDEQRRIVAVLDKAFAGIATATANAQKNLTNARALFESYLAIELTQKSGELKNQRLGEFVDVVSGAGFPKSAQGSAGEKYPFYKVSDMNLIGNEVFMKSEKTRFPKERERHFERQLCQQDQSFFQRLVVQLQPIKRILTKPSCVDNNVMGLCPKSGKVDSEFLSYWLKTINISVFAMT